MLFSAVASGCTAKRIDFKVYEGIRQRQPAEASASSPEQQEAIAIIGCDGRQQ